MFGYIRVYKPELTFREYEQYRGIYCSLCEALGRRYGLAARMTLSYDFTFLSIFRMALSDQPPVFYKGHCPFRPTKKRAFCGGESSGFIDYAADVAVILIYYKLSDTVCDEKGLKKAAAYGARLCLKRDFKKAVSRCPQEARWASEFMEAQAVVENQNSDSIDAAAHPTAEFLARLASLNIEDESVYDAAWRLGYALGRFIYLCDAAEDVADDVKHGGYNVFARRFLNEISDTVRDYMAQTLHQTVAICAECYEQLPIQSFDPIIRNIIYCGMPATIHRIHHGTKEDDVDEESL